MNIQLKKTKADKYFTDTISNSTIFNQIIQILKLIHNTDNFILVLFLAFIHLISLLIDNCCRYATVSLLAATSALHSVPQPLFLLSLPIKRGNSKGKPEKSLT